MTKSPAFRKGDKATPRNAKRAKTYGLKLGKPYKVTATIGNTVSKVGQYIELEGYGDQRFYASYFKEMP